VPAEQALLTVVLYALAFVAVAATRFGFVM
jgi:hypothetical protein